LKTTISVAGIDLELIDAGSGFPLLFLHGGQGLLPDHQYVDLLSKKFRVIAPSHPGFGKSGLPDWLDSVDDISYCYLELMDKLMLGQFNLVGCSIGGWLAAEIATKVPERIRKLVLVGPVGVKTGPPDKLDIPDIFATPQNQLQTLLFHDPSKQNPDFSKMSDDELAVLVRNRETLALLTWEPYMHNPKLSHRLHRVIAPTLLLRGAHDGLLSAEYLEAYAQLLPDSRIETIADAGHAPQIERPEAFTSAVLSFLNS